ncbi:28 kDa ribonucleoprotein, chloroplastic [Cicer arietinum]
MNVMALLRLPCLTPTQTQTQLYTKQYLIHFQNKPYSTNPNLFFSKSQSSFQFPTLSLIRTKQHANSTSEQVTVEEKEDTEELSRTRLLAQNVPWTSTAEDIRSLFEQHGKVLDVELSRYNKNRNRGLAFVEMSSPEEALAAFNSLESYEFEGRVIHLKYAWPKKEKTPPPVKQNPITFNLFVANLSYEARSKDLREFFDSGSGRVVSAEVIFNENPRRPSGYGFVSFKSKKEATEALSAFEGKNFMGRPIRVKPSKRFVQPAEESAVSEEDTSSELSVNEAEPDKAG